MAIIDYMDGWTHAAIIQEVKGGYRGMLNCADGYVYKNTYTFPTGRRLIDYYKNTHSVNKLMEVKVCLNVENTPENTVKDYNEYFDSRFKTEREELEKHPAANGPIYGVTVEDVANQIPHSGYVYVYQGGKWYVDLVNENRYNLDLEELIEQAKIEGKDKI